MKDKKRIILIFMLTVILIIGSILLVISINNKKIYCELDKSNYNSQIYYKLNENIKINYNHEFIIMDNAVDKYDEINNYLKLINNIDGVETNIEQEQLKLNYYININLNKISKDNYELLGIKDLMKNKIKKDIISYYEKNNYSCK